jgi:CheY-like chemotaxis protein
MASSARPRKVHSQKLTQPAAPLYAPVPSRGISWVEVAVVLVVEDEPLVRAAAVDIVERAGFVAIQAGSADEAISILESRGDIRLVFTDIEMPGSMDGLRLAHAVRQKSPPVLLLLASGAAIVEESQLPVGAKFFKTIRR